MIANDDLRSVFRPDVFEPALYAALREELHAGRVCIIRDAFDAAFAEEASRVMYAHREWHHTDVYGQPFVTFNSHAVIDRALFPPVMRRCESILGSAETRRTVGDLTGAATDGFRLFASKFIPGSYQLPHNDLGSGETGESVSFTWYLAKSWEPKWGGHFFWCSPPTSIAPTFNTVVLFRVTPISYHFVTPISPHAEGQRISLSGWWMGKGWQAPPPPARSPWYKGSVRELGEKLFVIG